MMRTGPNLDENVGHGLAGGGVHDADVDEHGNAYVAAGNISGDRLDRTRLYLSKGRRSKISGSAHGIGEPSAFCKMESEMSFR